MRYPKPHPPELRPHPSPSMAKNPLYTIDHFSLSFDKSNHMCYTKRDTVNSSAPFYFYPKNKTAHPLGYAVLKIWSG